MVKKEIVFICEQDGIPERELKKGLNQVFLNSGKHIRAYLVKIERAYEQSSSVALCVKTDNNYDEEILKKCGDVFKSIFSKDQCLDILFITQAQEQEIRKLCCPFYTSPNFQISIPDFFLFSSEGYNLDDTFRNCFKRKRLYGNRPDGYMLCDIDPVILGQSYGLGSQDINQIIIANRYEGTSLFPISEWPSYVYVTRPLIDGIEFKDTIEESDVELIAWAEIYKEKR